MEDMTIEMSHLPVQRMTDILKMVNQSLQAQLMVEQVRNGLFIMRGWLRNKTKYSWIC
jgi:aspartate carbamoyltransferase catalytic subunit